MNRFMLIALAVVLTASGCKAEFEPTGVTFQPSGPPEETVGSDDTGEPPQDLISDVPEGPKNCEDLWFCILENGCALAPQIEDSVCLKKCVGTQDDEHLAKFLELKECAAGACATEPTGDAITHCSFLYCTEKWFSCVAAGDGDKTCGDMHRCLIKDCGPDYTSAACISNCLRDGDKTADLLLSLMITCINAPLECIGGVAAACYAGSHGGHKSCEPALMCELGCCQEYCPEPGLCTNFDNLMECFFDCLWGLSAEEMERMYALQQCLVEFSHNRLIKDEYNIYSYCALQANECLGQQDEFVTCSDAYQCIKESYNYFPNATDADPQPFWMVAQNCLVDMVHKDKEHLSDALLCLHGHYEGNVGGQSGPWNTCKDSCEDD